MPRSSLGVLIRSCTFHRNLMCTQTSNFAVVGLQKYYLLVLLLLLSLLRCFTVIALNNELLPHTCARCCKRQQTPPAQNTSLLMPCAHRKLNMKPTPYNPKTGRRYHRWRKKLRWPIVGGGCARERRAPKRIRGAATTATTMVHMTARSLK